MQMDVGLDTGDMLHIAKIPIAADDTSASLYAKLAELGPNALIDALITIDTLTPSPQDNDLATYAHKLSKQAQLDWQLGATQLGAMFAHSILGRWLGFTAGSSD